MTEAERKWYTGLARDAGMRILLLMPVFGIGNQAMGRERILDAWPPLSLDPGQMTLLRGLSDYDISDAMAINARVAGHFGNMALGRWTRDEDDVP